MPVPALKSLASKSGKPLAQVEELWAKAKAQAAKQGHSEDYGYIMGTLKKMLGLGETYSPDDAILTTEALGAQVAEKLLTESMPAGVRQSLFQKYVNMELQFRRKLSGREVNWNFFLRSLREAVMILLNWVSGEEVKESSGDMLGVV